MNMIIENTAYRLRVRSDNGRILTGQRTYLSQGVTKRGKKYYKDMRWIAFEWLSDGRRANFDGIPSASMSKAELLKAINLHPLFTQARKELS